MRKSTRRFALLGLAALLIVAAVPLGAWLSIHHRPRFYRKPPTLPPALRRAEARRFEAQSLQLRNDLYNEPRWQATFTDEEINAWLAEELVAQFADQLPPGVHEPRVAFDADRITLAFGLDQGPFRPVIWVVARARADDDNVIALTLEKIRAGALPIAADDVLARIARRAADRGLDIVWTRDPSGCPVALIRYSPAPGRPDVVLERLQVLPGRLVIAGRSARGVQAIAAPRLPRGKLLQLSLPRRKVQSVGSAAPPALRSSAIPRTVAPSSRTRTRSGVQRTTT